jgi:hypothetical protein
MKNFVFATVSAIVVTVGACGGNVVVDGPAHSTTTGATGGTTTTASTIVTGAGAAGSNGPGAGAGPSAGPSTTTTTTTTSVSVSSSSGFGSCDSQCIAMFPGSFQLFEDFQRQECGCIPGRPCSTACSVMDCMATMPSQVSQACQACLVNQAQGGQSSMCTLQAVTQDCAANGMCKPFAQCAICCATMSTPC